MKETRATKKHTKNQLNKPAEIEKRKSTKWIINIIRKIISLKRILSDSVHVLYKLNLFWKSSKSLVLICDEQQNAFNRVEISEISQIAPKTKLRWYIHIFYICMSNYNWQHIKSLFATIIINWLLASLLVYILKYTFDLYRLGVEEIL